MFGEVAEADAPGPEILVEARIGRAALGGVGAQFSFERRDAGFEGAAVAIEGEHALRPETPLVGMGVQVGEERVFAAIEAHAGAMPAGPAPAKGEAQGVEARLREFCSACWRVAAAISILRSTPSLRTWSANLEPM